MVNSPTNKNGIQSGFDHSYMDPSNRPNTKRESSRRWIRWPFTTAKCRDSSPDPRGGAISWWAPRFGVTPSKESIAIFEWFHKWTDSTLAIKAIKHTCLMDSLWPLELCLICFTTQEEVLFLRALPVGCSTSWFQTG